MGVVSAGLLRIITPLFFVLPGLAAIKLFPNLARPDQAYLALVTNYVPTGLKGLILAGLAAALMSTLSTVVNSTSSLLTLDLYKQVKRDATEEQQLRFGRWSSVAVFVIGVLVALVFAANADTPLFIKMQDVFFYLAPPFAVIFTLGILWRRGNATAAVTTIVTGFLFTWVLDVWLFPGIALLAPYNTYLHRALLAWIFCMAVMIVTSLLTAPPPREKTEGIIWSRRYASLPAEEAARYRGWQDFRVWWLLFIAIALSIYAFFLWFRIRHPW
jgi:solute:Na+ symporter, SSS family